MLFGLGAALTESVLYPGKKEEKVLVAFKLCSSLCAERVPSTLSPLLEGS